MKQIIRPKVIFIATGDKLSGQKTSGLHEIKQNMNCMQADVFPAAFRTYFHKLMHIYH